MTKSLYLILAITITVVSFQNCSSQHQEGQSVGLNSVDVGVLQSAAVQVLSTNCTSCHSPNSGVVSNIDNILDVNALLFDGQIIPGEPQNSPIYLDIVDGVMPHNSNDLDPADMDKIRDWILALGDPRINAGVIGTPPPDTSGGGTGGTTATFSQIYATIISPRCVSCHNASRADGGVRLHNYASVFGQVNVSNPQSSPLFNEVNSGTMPPAGNPLTPTQVSLILTWIQAGAPNN